MGAKRRMGGATGASVAIHLAVAFAIPALAWTASQNAEIETVSFQHVLHIQVAPPLVRKPPAHAVAQRRAPSTALNLAHDVRVLRISSKHQAPPATIATNLPAAPAVADAQRAGTADGRGDAAPQPTPSPLAREVASMGHSQESGFLPFGAEQPTPVLDPGVRKQLDALGAHVKLIVTVGDDGRTANVVFQPPIDPQLENRIRSLLADASWDPAVCGGGVNCEGQAVINL